MSVVSVNEPRSIAQRYGAAFEERWSAQNPLTQLRRAALDEFLASGFPSQRDEQWKYTNLRRLEARTFAPAPRGALAVDARPHGWIEQAGLRIVLVNGYWMPSLCSVGAQPPGVTLLTLRQWWEHEPREVADFLSRSQQVKPGALESLNLAFCEDGVVLKLADGVRLDEPVYIVHQWTDLGGRAHMSHPRVIVHAGRGSHCTLIEHFIGPSDTEYFTNAVTTLDIADGATLDHYRLQHESARSFHIGHLHVRLERDSRYSAHEVALGASLGRLNIATTLSGPGSQVSLHGLIAPSGTQHLDSHTWIEHAAPHTTSVEDYRGIAADRGRGVFNGKVIVRPGAQQVDARQSSRNLLLSASAEIDTKPELEIYANDVKCSHGATTGQLDPTALFYLRSRGLSLSEARAALIRAFAESILSTIAPQPVRDHLEQLLENRYAL
jgi:Fe-S cluster assembly protein SufD